MQAEAHPIIKIENYLVVEIVYGKCEKATEDELPSQATSTLHQGPHHRQRIPLHQNLEHFGTIFILCFEPPGKCFASPFHLLALSQPSP